MANGGIDGIICQLRRAAMPHDGGLTDGQLLERFIAEREPLAFEALLRRHGSMVLAACRRVLRHEQDAEDAFQATFLVLVRKAASVNERASVGNWLYGVACRTAKKARAVAMQRQAKEQRAAMAEAMPEANDGQRELRALIDQELNRLPNKYREPLVLCDLEGQSRREAANQLGCPEGTVAGRLARARVMLAKRLTRRGLTLSVGALALVPESASAIVPPALVNSLVAAAKEVAARQTIAGVVSAPVASLTEGVLRAMFMNKIKRLFAAVLVLGIVSVGWSVYQVDAAPLDKKSSNQPPSSRSPESASAKEPLNFPKGMAPGQVFASMDKDGKLVIKSYVGVLEMPKNGAGARPGVGINGGGGFAGGAIGAPGGAGIVGGGGGGGGGAGVLGGGAIGFGGGGFGGGGMGPLGGGFQIVWKVQSTTYNLKEIEVVDTKGNPVSKSDLPKLLKEETLALATTGDKVDPLHLRLVKEGTLTFLLPAPKGGFNQPIMIGGGIAPGIGNPNPNPNDK